MDATETASPPRAGWARALDALAAALPVALGVPLFATLHLDSCADCTAKLSLIVGGLVWALLIAASRVPVVARRGAAGLEVDGRRLPALRVVQQNPLVGAGVGPELAIAQGLGAARVVRVGALAPVPPGGGAVGIDALAGYARARLHAHARRRAVQVAVIAVGALAAGGVTAVGGVLLLSALSALEVGLTVARWRGLAVWERRGEGLALATLDGRVREGGASDVRPRAAWPLVDHVPGLALDDAWRVRVGDARVVVIGEP